MRRVLAAALMGAAIVVVLAGSGCTNEERAQFEQSQQIPTPPANPGNPRDLYNTTWSWQGEYIRFADNGQAALQAQGGQQLMGTWELNNGVLIVTLGMTTKFGTWDGNELIIGGITCERAG